MSMKNSNNTRGNRTRDLPTCSAVNLIFNGIINLIIFFLFTLATAAVTASNRARTRNCEVYDRPHHLEHHKLDLVWLQIVKN